MVTAARALSAPLRVYWALRPEGTGGIGSPFAVEVASELAELRVFFVTLRVSSGPRPDLPEIIDALKKGGVRVTVSFSEARCFTGFVDIARADAIDLSPEDMPALEGLLGVIGPAPGGKPLSVSIVPARDNLDDIAGMFSRSLEAGIRAFGLPNPDIVSGGTDPERFVLDGAARERLKSALEPLLAPLGDTVKLAVHDLFLHRALDLPGLGGVVDYAGCQAGDALAFIEATGLVYPCSTWPEPLGRLGASKFREIWSSEWRSVMREVVKNLPEECDGCGEASICKGGCAGLAFGIGSLGGRDPGCKKKV